LWHIKTSTINFEYEEGRRDKERWEQKRKSTKSYMNKVKKVNVTVKEGRGCGPHRFSS